MSKSATQRREEKLAKELLDLAISNPARFKHEWETMLCFWSMEAIRRGRILQKEPVSENSSCPQLPVFDILKKAERLLAMCGSEAEQLVGAKTRELLNHDCGKSFSKAVDQRMYQLTVKLGQPKIKDRTKTSRGIPAAT
jgi:hypothetical protein